jgi:hypothetical protein
MDQSQPNQTPHPWNNRSLQLGNTLSLQISMKSQHYDYLHILFVRRYYAHLVKIHDQLLSCGSSFISAIASAGLRLSLSTDATTAHSLLPDRMPDGNDYSKQK